MFDHFLYHFLFRPKYGQMLTKSNMHYCQSI